MKNELDLESFKGLFSEGWWKKIGKWFETEDAFETYRFIKERAGSGNTVFPTSDRVFRAFKDTDPNNIKAIFVGLAPYHSVGRNGKPHADGLAFSASLTNEIPPSLVSFYDAIDKDLGWEVERHPDLGYLSEQGVLLLNYSLTCEKGKATIHTDKELWDDFNRFFYGEVLASACGIPIVLMGKVAQSLERYLFKMCHPILKVEHPVMAAREHREWRHNGLFNWCNKILKENNGPYHSIEWDKSIFDMTPWN